MVVCMNAAITLGILEICVKKKAIAELFFLLNVCWSELAFLCDSHNIGITMIR